MQTETVNVKEENPGLLSYFTIYWITLQYQIKAKHKCTVYRFVDPATMISLVIKTLNKYTIITISGSYFTYTEAAAQIMARN